MGVISNLDITDTKAMTEALRTNFKGVSNKKYIKDSISYHLREKFITSEQADELKKEYDIF